MSSKTTAVKEAPVRHDWTVEAAENSLHEHFADALRIATVAIEYYQKNAGRKKKGARGIRIAAIGLGAFAALIPTLSELVRTADGPIIKATWSTVFLVAAGTLLLLDRYFGYSSAWMRFIVAELQLRQEYESFRMDWEAERSLWAGARPAPEKVREMLLRCRDFISRVNSIIREETGSWVKEFQDAIQQIDNSLKSKGDSGDRK